ncbi:MAG: aminopeptidase [Anaerolineae bacterium]|nr:aminopeptidase [Anaerolineae bacterium]NUQ02300.1 aminopeptidase [Anaerolineae bacterium]
MTDIRVNRLADILVNYSTRVQPGEWVGVLGDVAALPLIRAVHDHVVKAGGNPVLMLSDEYMTRSFARFANDEQVKWLDPSQSLYYDSADVYIRCGAIPNTRASTNVDPVRMQQIAAARRSWLDTRMRRAAEGKMKWVGTLFPTEGSAQEANMSLEEYEDFVFGATFADRDDPVTAWRAMGEMQQKKIDWLKGKKHVKLQGPNIDLELSIADRVFINACGERNMPDGEIFTGPVEDSVNGWYRATFPSIVQGQVIEGIELRFAEGKVVEAKARNAEALLFSRLDADARSRYLGEFAIGTNFGIQKFTGSILFDEKIGGTVHVALGHGYPDTGSKNVSTIHWDMICDMRTDSTIHVDGELFYKDGQFVV